MTGMAAEGAKSVADLLPRVEAVTYERNLIGKAVCELRFPTIYGLVRGKPPVALANALRKAFPEHGMIDGLNVGFAGVAQDFAFVFKDKKKQSSVTLRPSALSFETSAYRSFEELLESVLVVSSAAKEVIDSDFFTRIGLRYINGLPFNPDSIGDWVNAELVAPLAKGTFGRPMEYSGRIASESDGAGFLIQHGLGKEENTKTDQYVLDFDVWREDVSFTDLQKVIEELHDTELRLFHWSIGKAALAHMGRAKPKAKKG